VLPGDWSSAREACYYALATAGAVAGVWNGQNNALVTGLLLLAAAALARDRDWNCAGWLAIAINLKLTPLPAALLLCAAFPRRLAGRFVLTVAAIGLVPFLTRPPLTVLQHYTEFFAQQQALARQRWPGFRDAWTAWQVVQHSVSSDAGPVPLTADLDSQAYRLLQAATAGACLVWCLAQRLSGRALGQVVRHTLSMGAGWLMLFGPAVESPTYVFLAPFLAAAAVDWKIRPESRGLAVAACALIFCFGFGAVSLRLAATFPPVLLALPLGTTLYIIGLALAFPPRRGGLASAATRTGPIPSLAFQREREIGSHPLERQVDPQHAEGLEEACVG
jgi:hypothetical protein